MKPKYIKVLLETPVVGNHYSDAPLLRALDDFASDRTQSREDRAAAVRRFGEVMGMPYLGADEDVLRAFEAE